MGHKGQGLSAAGVEPVWRRLRRPRPRVCIRILCRPVAQDPRITLVEEALGYEEGGCLPLNCKIGVTSVEESLELSVAT